MQVVVVVLGQDVAEGVAQVPGVAHGFMWIHGESCPETEPLLEARLDAMHQSAGDLGRAVGEQVQVCVVLREGQTLSETDLKNYCREKLPAFMAPDRFRFYEELPKTPTGKILKTQLREDAAGS